MMNQRNNGAAPTPAGTLPPHDIDAERAVLGALLINGDLAPHLAGVLRPEDFFREHHSWIYEACMALSDRGEPINEVTVGYELSVRGRLGEAGGPAYLADLTISVPSSLYGEQYAAAVLDTALRRNIMKAAYDMMTLAYDPQGKTADAVLTQAEESLLRLRRNAGMGFVHIRDVLSDVLQFPGSPTVSDDTRDMTRLPTGFPALDSLIGGFNRSNLVTIAARPGMGKTSLLIGFGRNAAVQYSAGVAIFSLEMSKEELVERMLSAEAAVESQRLRLGHLTPKEYERLWPAAGKLASANIMFHDAASVTVAEMRSRLRQLQRQSPVDLVLVDYLQLVSPGPTSQRQNRAEQVSEITRGLKALARELNVPVIAASQLNRQVEHRPPPIPLLSDLRESGAIEQDSDLVAFIHRDDVHYTEEQWEAQYPTRRYPRGIARIIVAKHRNGPTGERDLFFREQLSKFETLAWEGQG